MSRKKELFEYYNERAPEYEEFYRGEFRIKITNPEIYQNDTSAISRLLPDYISGKCIDIACGTGFWVPVYEKNCTMITLIDQSENVLAECSKKVKRLGIEDKTEIIQDNIFGYPFEDRKYDSALIGFLISHLTDTRLVSFFNVIEKLLVPTGKFAIIDNTWNEEIARIRGSKAGVVKRTLKDGCEFEIYKRYFEKPDIYNLAGKHNFELEIVYWGKVFFLAAGKFTGV